MTQKTSRLKEDYSLEDGTVRRAYTTEEDAYLLFNYTTAPREEIEARLRRNWNSIVDHSSKILGLKRPNIRTHQLAVLLPNNLVNAYWWGFIMADGYISNKGILRVALSDIDRDHLEKLSTYIGKGTVGEYSGGMVYLDACDKINGLALLHKLNITARKTYNPPSSFDFLLTPEERLAFFIGFSDGDGSIQFDHNDSFKSLRIVVHHNWYLLLEGFCATLAQENPLRFTVNNTNSRGNTSVYLGTKASHQYLRDFIIANGLPALDRKWRLSEDRN